MSAVRSITVDVALRLPEDLRELSLRLSAMLAKRMSELGHRSGFRLGEPFPGATDGGVCEPHVSLFMLRLDRSEIESVLRAVRSVAGGVPAIHAVGAEYRHNPQGAPELYFRKSAGWIALQRAVVAATEPLRRGRLRPHDPAGARLTNVIDSLHRDDPDCAQLRQLLTYGYDEITDDAGDRFNPHVTLAWPVDHLRVDLADLPAAADFSGTLTDLAVYGMNSYGTCTEEYGVFRLTGVM
jgi:hypothetical protein